MPSHGVPRAASDARGGQDDSFAPLAALQAALHSWWFLFLLMTAGGLLGWLFHRANPPLYQAVGQFSATIDVVRSGPLSENDQDVAMNGIGALINSQTVLERVAAGAAKEGLQTSPARLKQQAAVERQVNAWFIRLRDTDPARAERLVNLWVEQGQAVLEESYASALRAEQALRALDALETCLEQPPVAETLSGQCGGRRYTDIQADMQALGKEYAAARKASRGLFPGLVPGPVEPALLNPRPVVRGRAELVLAGSLLGLLAGLALLHLGIPGRLLGKK